MRMRFRQTHAVRIDSYNLITTESLTSTLLFRDNERETPFNSELPNGRLGGRGALAAASSPPPGQPSGCRCRPLLCGDGSQKQEPIRRFGRSIPYRPSSSPSSPTVGQWGRSGPPWAGSGVSGLDLCLVAGAGLVLCCSAWTPLSRPSPAGAAPCLARTWTGRCGGCANRTPSLCIIAVPGRQWASTAQALSTTALLYRRPA